MWSRVVEVMLGVWLALSPFIFRHDPEQSWLWIHDFVCAVVVMALAMVSYWNPMRHAHFALIGVGGWLIAVGFLAEPYPTPPALQNHVTIGLLLMMFGVIPNHVSQPPRGWQEFNREAAAKASVNDRAS